MDGHGIARHTPKTRTPEQLAAELDKIDKYRALEVELRAAAAADDYGPATLALTTRLLRANPEYYTAWNARRRCIISGLSSRPSAGSWPSTASPTSSATATATPSFEVSSTSSSTGTRPGPASPTAGRSGTTAEGIAAPAEGSAPDTQDDEQQQQQQHEQTLDTLRAELAFTVPLLIEYPKCYWIWSYREWTLQQVTERLPPALARRPWEEELGLVSKMLTKDRRNFHAWVYRRHVVAALESRALEGRSMAEPEFEYTTRMIRVDLSNFSAWHNRTQLIPRLLEERGADDAARQKFLDDELSLVREALNVGPEDQSLWYYHQFLILNLVEHTARATITPRLAPEDRVSYITREIEDIRDLLEDYDDIKRIYEALLEYTLALAQVEEREPSGDEKGDMKAWLARLRALDPMRAGRWDDTERQYGLA